MTEWKTTSADSTVHNRDIKLYDKPIKHYNDKFKIIGDVHFDLQMNDGWSDLTAILKILQADNYITLELNEIHVL